jgi:uncharacterized protein (DUF1501 family)
MPDAPRLSRRTVLASLGAGGALAALPQLALPGLGRVAFAAAPQDRCLVVLFLRGGADGLMLVGPTADRTYVADRPPDLRVLDSGDHQGLPLANALDPRVDFRLHHELAPLAELYRDKTLAIVHAAGITDGTRSHFVAQDLIERGVAREGDIPHTPTGWLTRLVGGLPQHPALVRAACVKGSVDACLAGFGPALAVPDLAGGIGLYGGDPTHSVLSALYRDGTDPMARAMRTAVATLSGLDQRLPRKPDGKPAPYQPENQAAYDNADAGRGLRVVAELLKLEVGMSLAAVDMGGWDTHEGQPGRFANQARQLAGALAAFWNDIARYHERVTVVVMTEFGRRLRANLSQGTDHGHAAVMLALGAGVNGGRMYGAWPGLASDVLDHGVDLAVTTDYRAVLAEIAQARFGVAPTAVFPEFKPPAPLGLVRA